MGESVLTEAKRCLQCKKPLCKEGCPVNTPVNEIVKMLLEGEISEAGEKLFNNNPLSLVCSLICPHSRQCEGHCILGKKGNPIQVSHIENYISDYYLNLLTIKYKIDKNKKVAIIGSGPAGITIAFILASKGYDITIFEAHDKIGGVMRYGIPEFRLPKEILDRIKEKLIQMGIKIRPNTLIGPTITVDDLFRDGYKAVFIGTGVWKPRGLTIKGETLGNVHYAIDYLKNPNVYTLGKKVCIIGAGNVAMDVARTVLRNGSREVYIIFRAGEEHIEADRIEVEYAKMDGVKFLYYTMPLEISDEGIKCVSTELRKDEDGRLPLHTACWSGNIYAVKKLVELVPKQLWKKDHAGFTPLELVENLIENPEALSMLEQQSRKNGYPCGTQQELVKIVEILEQAIPLKC